MGVRRSFWWTLAGKPSGPLGWVGAHLLVMMLRPVYRAMAVELELQPDDDLLDVGCGAAGLLAEHASHVRYVAGLDASEIQVGMARRRLADRLAAGSAEIVLGYAGRLPWDDGRFSVVTSLNVLKFVPDPEGALREMHRVLRPGGRLVVTMGESNQTYWGATAESGTADAWGQWQWSDADAQRLMEAAGFEAVAVSVLRGGFKLVRGTKPVAVPAEESTRSVTVQPQSAGATR
jgi:SAM-dependent methyltransferase